MRAVLVDDGSKSLTFALTALVIVATPGTGVVLTVAVGLRGGRELAVVTAFGCTLGIVPHLAAAITAAMAPPPPPTR